MMLAFINKKSLFLIPAIFLLAGFARLAIPQKETIDILTAKAEAKTFDVTVKTVGVLEAKNSVVLFSAIKGDLGKIIDLVGDGTHVNENDVVVRLDPAPFEHKLEEVEAKIREQQAAIEGFKQGLAQEKDRSVLEEKAAEYELENALVERDKIVMGDGPMEEVKLKRALDKAEGQYLELKAYENELDKLEKQGFLSQGEKRQAVKKLEDARETYEEAKTQYESFVHHVYPMQVKKAEVNLKRAEIKYEDIVKSSAYKVAKSRHLLDQALLGMKYLERQKIEVLEEIRMTKIRAPMAGMAVLREEFRSGEKRKPRVGDVALKNQPLLNLPDLSRMVVKTKVREVDLHKVSVGKSASVEIDAYPGLSLTGKVSSIGVLALSDYGRTSEKYFEVRILLDTFEEVLRPGMTARVCLHSAAVEDKIAIPVNAVFINESESFCYKKSQEGFTPYPVTLGLANESWVEVKSGIASGDIVSLLPR